MNSRTILHLFFSVVFFLSVQNSSGSAVGVTHKSISTSKGEKKLVNASSRFGGANCCILDLCLFNRWLCTTGGVVTDSCGTSFYIAHACKVASRTCCFRDQCEPNVKCVSKGTTYKDSCGDEYEVSDTCGRTEVDKTCCYTSLCNQKGEDCFKRGTERTDSCENLIKVASDSCERTVRKCCPAWAGPGQKACIC